MRQFILTTILLSSLQLVFAENSILEKYIAEGLDNNLALKQKEFSLKKSILELRESQKMSSLYPLPSVIVTVG